MSNIKSIKIKGTKYDIVDAAATHGVVSTDKVLKLSGDLIASEISLVHDSTNHLIKLIGKNNTVISSFSTNDFIKDGMLYGQEIITATATSQKVTIKGMEFTITGLTVGHKYLILCFSNGAVTPTYSCEKLDVQELVDVYTAGDGIEISTTNVVSVSDELMDEIDGKLDKIATTGNTRVYSINASGGQGTIQVASGSTASTIALRGTGGTLQVGAPTADDHATTKKYVDDGLSAKANNADLATVAKTGDFDDLVGKPNLGTTKLDTDGAEISLGNTEYGQVQMFHDDDTVLEATTEGLRGVINFGLTDAAHNALEKAKTAMQPNTAITGSTKCKITYDSKGLVTAGADLVASDIPSLAASKITSGTFADARIASASTWNAKYTKPSTGIPATDLASAVQTSLGKADTAVQPADLPSGEVDLTLTSTSISDGTTTFEVKANDSATASTTLTKLKVGGTNYNVPQAVTVDSAMSSTSTNPVQNKVINTALANKAASAHTHGGISNNGAITSDTAIAGGDQLVFADSSNSGKLARSNISFGTNEGLFLTNKGTWSRPSVSNAAVADINVFGGEDQTAGSVEITVNKTPYHGSTDDYNYTAYDERIFSIVLDSGGTTICASGSAIYYINMSDGHNYNQYGSYTLTTKGSSPTNVSFNFSLKPPDWGVDYYVELLIDYDTPMYFGKSTAIYNYKMKTSVADFFYGDPIVKVELEYINCIEF